MRDVPENIPVQVFSYVKKEEVISFMANCKGSGTSNMEKMRKRFREILAPAPWGMAVDISPQLGHVDTEFF